MTVRENRKKNMNIKTFEQRRASRQEKKLPRFKINRMVEVIENHCTGLTTVFSLNKLLT